MTKEPAWSKPRTLAECIGASSTPPEAPPSHHPATLLPLWVIVTHNPLQEHRPAQSREVWTQSIKEERGSLA